MVGSLKFLLESVQSVAGKSFFLQVLLILVPFYFATYLLYAIDIGILYSNPLLNLKDILLSTFLISTILYLSSSFLVAAFLFFGIQGMFFLTYLFLKRSISYLDFQLLDELFLILPIGFKILAVLTGLLVVAVSLYCNRRLFSPKRLMKQVLIIALVVASFLVARSQAGNLRSAVFEDIIDGGLDTNINFRAFGSIYSFVFSMVNTWTFENKMAVVDTEGAWGDYRDFKLSENTKKNIHVILVESMLDPFALSESDKIKDQVDPIWFEWLDKAKFITAPGYGGGSAASEFEILCGVDSLLGHYSGFAYNYMTGKTTDCLPSYLAKQGYKSYASTPLWGGFYNIGRAYKSAGFENIWLRDSYEFDEVRNNYLSDTSFLRQQKNLMLDEIKSGSDPFLNFIFTTSCHGPYNLYDSMEPLVNISGMATDLNNVATCSLYTIRAIISYVKTMQERFPDDVFVILPDHQPAVSLSKFDNVHGFPKNLERIWPYLNRVMFVSSTEVSTPNILDYREIGELVLNHLSQSKLCKDIDCSSDSQNLFERGVYFDRKTLQEVNLKATPTEVQNDKELLRRQLFRILRKASQ